MTYLLIHRSGTVTYSNSDIINNATKTNILSGFYIVIKLKEDIPMHKFTNMVINGEGQLAEQAIMEDSEDGIPF